MPIVYVHGVAVREEEKAESKNASALDGFLQSIAWETVEGNLRKHVAPAISDDPSAVPLSQAYWGDLGAKLAWKGASCMPDVDAEYHDGEPRSLISRFREHLAADFRNPANQLIARFMGDVFLYLSNRGDSSSPGPIPQRVLTALEAANSHKEATGEPLIVVTNSMGCEILYDIVTYYLPNCEHYRNIKIDYWCATASQVGLFEELKLFKVSSDRYGQDKGNKVPFPDSAHLGTWWNVWDFDDIISYSVADIIEGVDDTPYRVGRSLMNEHLGYLQEERFYKTLAHRIKEALSRKG